MKLSVIVINHNLCAMLRQTLSALVSAAKGIDYEVLIVDNNSADGSVDMVQNEYPGFHVIASQKYQSYTKLCNEALGLASGQYILLVNPEVLSSAKTLERVIEFMDEHADTGALGVRMVTPQGEFLHESNRGLTQPWINFFKLTGMARFFPKSRLSDRNRKDWVEEFQTAEVDFINGGFMFMRRSVLTEVGLLDERFAEYGYDIDLSYRIRLAGYKNYYYPKTYVIDSSAHNTLKFNWQFIKYFYGAMIIFAAKYLFRMPELKLAGIPKMPLLYEAKG
ncbi:MAG: glycosyltransferase family 2 protein [Mucilaginibacter sp.]